MFIKPIQNEIMVLDVLSSLFESLKSPKMKGIKIIYNSLSFVRFLFSHVYKKISIYIEFHADAFKWIKNNFDLND